MARHRPPNDKARRPILEPEVDGELERERRAEDDRRRRRRRVRTKRGR